jgi:ribonucleoside-diphosphate reductase beta chain
MEVTMQAQTQTEQLDDELERVAQASVSQLGDIRIDDVLLFLDRGLDRMPSYLDLYRRWETQQWAIFDLDFRPDVEVWRSSSQFDRDSALWARRLFFIGEERVTATLAPFVWAAPTPEIELFLSTQMVDEARHTLFFERWWRQVVGSDTADLATLIEQVRPEVNEGFNQLFYDRLPGIAQRIASHPRDLDAFIEGVTIYHIVVEGTLALTGMRFELEAMRAGGLQHLGFYRGFTAVARDESRHVNFGVKVLQEAVRDDAERFAPLIQQTLLECLPLIAGALEPPDPRYLTESGFTCDEIFEFAMNSLNKRLHSIGINLAA